jgi:DNA topoisomerase II
MSLQPSPSMYTPSTNPENTQMNTVVDIATETQNLVKKIVKKIVTNDSKSLSKIFVKLSELEHLLHRPDMYVGSVEVITAVIGLIDHSQEKPYIKMVSSEYCPALLKIIDEAIVNILDHSWRVDTANKKTMSSKMKKAEKAKAMLLPVENISISVNADTNEVCIMNDGEGIPVEMHDEHKVYIPELIFAHFRTGTNFNDTDNKCTGGKNGYGIKLVNAFSTQFEIETIDRDRKLKYTQLFENNLSVKHPPVIVPYEGASYTKLTFIPDLPRFGMNNGWTPTMLGMIEKRTYDLSACAGAHVHVKYNDQPIVVKDFNTYMQMFSEAEYGCFSEKINDRWEVGVALSDDGFKQQSFVNGVCTIKGGKHVDYIANQIARHVCKRIEEKKKVKVKTMFVRDNLMLFVKAMIENPAFDGQTKETLTTPSSKFGSKCELPNTFMEKLYGLGLMERVIELYQFKELAKTKKEDGKKRSRISGIPKLDDANKAGGKESAKCTLILTEGDSAKAMAISGLSVVGRDYYGVFPLRGKMINARDKQTSIKGMEQMSVNEEMCNLKIILGLEQGREYKTEEDIAKHLRYGKVMVMTDQDVDGSHIKGLFMNWIDSQWKELLELNFITAMITPIIKVKRKSKELAFYSIGHYMTWCQTAEGKQSGWKTKYYKGLGTSTTNEAKEYFRALKQVHYFMDDTKNESLDMAFAKERADDRKGWMKEYNISDVLDSSTMKVSYNDFIHKELKHFSVYDTQRSISHLVDGLKPSQRKILYACFKRKLTTEIKVAQLAGYVSEHTGYHHGEMSLNMAIIGMAQQFVGSNNLNILQPNGQFGTRLQGGKDAASPRYIFTLLNPLTSLLFHPDDQPLLEYLDDDGHKVEPRHYVPILPIALLNGVHGVGTGYSTSVPMYNPLEVCDAMIGKLKAIVKGKEYDYPELRPSYNHFKGDIIKLHDKSYLTKGKYYVKDFKTVVVHELPVEKWTDDYKEFLETLLVNYVPPKKRGSTVKVSKHNGVLKEYTSHCTESDVHFELEFKPEILKQWLNTKNDDPHVDYFEKQLKLTSKLSLTNMHLFDANSRIHKYDNTTDIMTAFYDVRYDYYGRRKEYQLGVLQHQLDIIHYKVKFLEAVITDDIVVAKQSKAELIAKLEEQQYPKFASGDAQKTHNYNYLLTMPIYTLTTDTLDALRKLREEKQTALSTLQTNTLENMWCTDLKTFRKEYISIQNKTQKENEEQTAKNAKMSEPKKKKQKMV